MNAGGKAEDVKHRKRRYPNYITSLKDGSRVRCVFIVADTETLLSDSVHVPHAIGFLVVKPGEDVGVKGDSKYEIYFSEDNIQVIQEFKENE